MKVFYAWQSDLDREEHDLRIRKEIRGAIQSLKQEVVGRPEMDHDTRGVPGTPDIMATIHRKIDSAAVFIGDVSFVGETSNGKKLTNPNVMYEIGYAAHSLGWEKIILVASKEGTDRELPFDIRSRRGPVRYDPENPGEFRKELKNHLKQILKKDGSSWEGVKVGERFFVWDGPFDDLSDRGPRLEDEDFLKFELIPALRMQRMFPSYTNDPRGMLVVFETDEERTWKRQVLGCGKDKQTLIVAGSMGPSFASELIWTVMGGLIRHQNHAPEEVTLDSLRDRVRNKHQRVLTNQEIEEGLSQLCKWKRIQWTPTDCESLGEIRLYPKPSLVKS